MDIDKKQLRFSFSAGIFYVMIIKIAVLSVENCFALEQLPPFSYYEVIEQRNMFRPNDEQAVVSPEQKPEPPAPVEVSVPGLNNYVLTGVVKIRGKFKATISDKSSGKGHYVGVHDLLDDFKVTDIQRGKVVLEKDGEMYELKIHAPASRVADQDPSDNTSSSEKTTAPKETFNINSETNGRSNVMQSIRMGTPNVKSR